MGGLNPAVVESNNVGLTPTEEDVREAHWVLQQYDRLAQTGETWMEFEGRVIDRYEAERARDTLEWAAACAERNKGKADAVARTKAALGS